MSESSRSPRLPAQRAREIAELAEQVSLSRYRSGKVEPIAIARSQGMTYSFNDYGDAFDGMLEHRAGRFHIYVNLQRVERPDSGRARFTVAHELGHFFIDEHRNALGSGRVLAHGSLCDHESKNTVEMEADHFASNLLMPAQRFVAEARRYSTGMPAISRLAAYFGTSLTSTAIRYASLDVAPCVVLKWSDTALAWKWLSRDAFDAKLFRPVTIDDLPGDSPTSRALRGETATGGHFEAATTVSAWFHSVAANGSRNVLLMEQAIQLGRFGVLTLIFPIGGSYTER